MKNLDMKNIVVVIPSYIAPENLLTQVTNLQRLGFGKIIVVDDGSPPESKIIFNQLENIILLSNDSNRGKGEALKLAYKYILSDLSDYNYAITCDDDGQHHPEDVLKVAQAAASSNTNYVYFGSRSFKYGVPVKSLLGNLSTEILLLLITRVHINDTQTGLRCIPISLLPMLIEIPCSKFNFEFATLLSLIKYKYHIKEIPIRTIYFNNNRGTRFRGIQDSLSILATLMKYFNK